MSEINKKRQQNDVNWREHLVNWCCLVPFFLTYNIGTILLPTCCTVSYVKFRCYSKVKITCIQYIKVQILLKKSDLAISVSCNFCYPSFLLGSILSPPGDSPSKWLNPLCWAKIYDVEWSYLASTNYSIHSDFFMHMYFCMHECVCKTILCAQKSVHANIKFVEQGIYIYICIYTYMYAYMYIYMYIYIYI